MAGEEWKWVEEGIAGSEDSTHNLECFMTVKLSVRAVAVIHFKRF